MGRGRKAYKDIPQDDDDDDDIENLEPYRDDPNPSESILSNQSGSYDDDEEFLDEDDAVLNNGGSSHRSKLFDTMEQTRRASFALDDDDGARGKKKKRGPKKKFKKKNNDSDDGGPKKKGASYHEVYYDDYEDVYHRKQQMFDLQKRLRQKQERRRRSEEYSTKSRNSCMTCIWCCCLLILLVVTLVLVFIRYEQTHDPEELERLSKMLHGNESIFYKATHERIFDDDDGLPASSSILQQPHDDDDDEDATPSSSAKSKHHTGPIQVVPTPSKEVVTSDLFRQVEYNKTAGLHYYNPFSIQTSESALASPLWWTGGATGATDNNAYMIQPDIIDNHLVFVAEGDLYHAILPDNTQSLLASRLAAIKCTTTVGNVRTPKLNPRFPYLVAFTATYTGHRELYLLNLQRQGRAGLIRLSYWDDSHPIAKVVGWNKQGTAILVAARSRVYGSLPSTRLYALSLVHNTPTASQGESAWLDADVDTAVLNIQDVPLAQATDGVFATDGNGNDCVFFVRHKQSSHTVRYVGGTVEHIWLACLSTQEESIPLFEEYNGTIKSPQVHNGLLYFASDFDASTHSTPTTMNLFVMSLPDDLTSFFSSPKPILKPIALTSISCHFNGRALQEFSIDPKTGNVVLRVGADFFFLSAETIQGIIASPSSLKAPRPIPIQVISDFQEQQERLIRINLAKHLKSVDAFETAFGGHACLMGVRGQVHVAPVETRDADDSGGVFLGLGMNLPSRRYRVAPGATMGGFVRILVARHVPLMQETSTRRLAVILASTADATNDKTDDKGGHGFYMMEVQNEASPTFADINDLPRAFLGGNSASVQEGGLGSVYAESVTVSPCGRRMAWVNTDGQINVMNLPMYQENGTTAFVTLTPKNDNGAPIVGDDDTEMSFSPGGRYLAVKHDAKNQFSVISIADLGNPDVPTEEETRIVTKVAPVSVGPIVQATPDRFNSISPYWGKSAADIAQAKQAASLAELLEIKKSKVPDMEDGSTVLYFLTDRDIVSDVKSPWGTRAPTPHLKTNRWSVWALPLLGTNPLYAADLVARRGTFAGGGAAELWGQGIVQHKVQLEELKESKKAKLLASLLAEKEEEKKKKKHHSHYRWLQESASVVPGTDPSAGDWSRDPDNSSPPPSSAGQSGDWSRQQDPNAILTGSPSWAPSSQPSGPKVTQLPSATPSQQPSHMPSSLPSAAAITSEPSGVPSAVPSAAPSADDSDDGEESATKEPKSLFPKDHAIDFDDFSFGFMRRAYKMGNIPSGRYLSILCQLQDDPSLVVIEKQADGGLAVNILNMDDFPSDNVDPTLVYEDKTLQDAQLSTSRDFIILVYAPETIKVVSTKASSIVGMMKDPKNKKDLADTKDLSISVWPALEYRQIYNDAWRMLRDYFYDVNMHGVDWNAVHARYKDLVPRCRKREDLDDVMSQMAAELSALHVFVYGGEYSDPLHGDKTLKRLHEVSSLGANLVRSMSAQGYVVTRIGQHDPDFPVQTGNAIWSPLGHDVLKLSGQRGLLPGDVIVGINGESVMSVPDMHMLLRGQAGRSVRLDVLRLASNATNATLSNMTSTTGFKDAIQVKDGAVMKSEPLIVVPLSLEDSKDLRYLDWEWRTRQKAKEMAAARGFGVGYIHLQSMEGPEDIDNFLRGFFPDHDQSGLIVDVRHNVGGNIDSWLLDVLQRKAFMYWQARASSLASGGLGWNERFSFRGHIVVLIDEKSSSDAEGFARGMSELGLAKLVGKRTWGGGIWLSSDNVLVDGGIATAPEIGVYNDKFGWGGGVEQSGVEPDVLVDNEPRTTFNGNDRQLEAAIQVLDEWLKREPMILPKPPGPKRDMSLDTSAENCPAAPTRTRRRRRI